MVLHNLFSSLGTYAAVATVAAVLLGLVVKLGACRLRRVIIRLRRTPMPAQQS